MWPGSPKRKDDIIDHWYALIDEFDTSSRDFYSSIKSDLDDYKLPGLELFHVDFAEGGVLSAKREYLRLTRERLVFDICAAPFGRAFFFSCRFAETPAPVKLWHIFVLLILGYLVTSFALKLFGTVSGIFGTLLGIPLLVYVLRNAVALGLQDLDAVLIKTPVLGPVYEAWFRKDTYYRIDTRLMYRDAVNEIVKARVEDVTAQKGVKLVRYNEASPILGELYKSKIVPLPETEPSPLCRPSTNK